MKHLKTYLLILVIGLSAAFALSFLPTKSGVKTAQESQVDANDLSIEKAIKLVKEGSNPMAGITMLKDIAEKDPKNTEALRHLAFFSIQSGQLDKAIQRFEQIHAIDESKTDVLYYLGGLYQETGQKDKALEYYEKFQLVNKDDKLNQSIDQQIKILTNS